LIALGAPVAANADLYQTTNPYDVVKTALDSAVVRGDPEILKILLEARAKWTREQLGEALLSAAERGKADLAAALIGSGADPAYARPNPHPGKGRGNFKGPGQDGRTVLMNAVRSGTLTLVKSILERKPNVNAGEEFGWTALHFAAEPYDTRFKDPPTTDRVKIVELLIAAGATPDARTDAGDTPVTVCQRYADVCATLVKAAAAKPVAETKGVAKPR
jgi:ankyrin repeat protein